MQTWVHPLWIPCEGSAGEGCSVPPHHNQQVQVDLTNHSELNYIIYTILPGAIYSILYVVLLIKLPSTSFSIPITGCFLYLSESLLKKETACKYLLSPCLLHLFS